MAGENPNKDVYPRLCAAAKCMRDAAQHIPCVICRNHILAMALCLDEKAQQYDPAPKAH